MSPVACLRKSNRGSDTPLALHRLLCYDACTPHVSAQIETEANPFEEQFTAALKEIQSSSGNSPAAQISVELPLHSAKAKKGRSNTRTLRRRDFSHSLRVEWNQRRFLQDPGHPKHLPCIDGQRSTNLFPLPTHSSQAKDDLLIPSRAACIQLLRDVGIPRWKWDLVHCRWWVWCVLRCVKHNHVQAPSKVRWCGCSSCLERMKQRFCGTGAAIFAYEREDWLTVCGGYERVACLFWSLINAVKNVRSMAETAEIPIEEWTLMLSRSYGLRELSKGDELMRLKIGQLRKDVMWAKYSVTTLGPGIWSTQIIDSLLADNDCSFDPRDPPPQSETTIINELSIRRLISRPQTTTIKP